MPSWKSCFSVSHKPEILLLWMEEFHVVSSTPGRNLEILAPDRKLKIFLSQNFKLL